MKSRMAIVAMLVSGIVMSTAGTGLAVTGLTDTDSAAEGQYGPVITTPAPTPETPAPPATLGGPQGEVQGEAETAAPAPAPAPKEEKKEEATPAPAPAPAQAAGPAQAPRQVVAVQSGNELPFTGFSAIPVLLVGLGLLAGGLVLRRRTREHRA